MLKAAREHLVPALLLVFVFVVAIVVPVLVYRSSFSGGLSGEQVNWGVFGDFLGGVGGTILSLAAFFGLMMTFVLQGKQLKELKEAERVRRLEETVGGLLDALESILKELDLRGAQKDVYATGRDVIRNIYEKKLKGKYLAKNRNALARPLEEERAFVRAVFDETFREHGAEFGHYFRTLYRIVLTIDESAKDECEAQRLLSWLTCRLSRYELLLLFYNCLGSVGEMKFHGLCQKYSLLEHVERDRLIQSRHEEFYASSAYGDES